LLVEDLDVFHARAVAYVRPVWLITMRSKKRAGRNLLRVRSGRAM